MQTLLALPPIVPQAEARAATGGPIRTKGISPAEIAGYGGSIESEARSASSIITAAISGRQTVVLANGETATPDERACKPHER
jgi:hypothetical protein